jgi:tetratricopeptide (TPR) repeat protein
MRFPYSLLITVLVTGCTSQTRLPELPVVDSSKFQPRVREAIESALRKAKEQPRNAEAVARLGMALHAHDLFSPAAQCYHRAHLLEPGKFDYDYLWGAALVSLGRYSEALIPLRRALTVDSQSIPARLKLAGALLEAGEKQEAGREYQLVLKQSPQLPAAFYGLGRTQSGEPAIASFEKALSLFPHYGAAQFALAAAYRQAGQAAKAGEILAGYERDKTNTPPLDDPLMEAVYSLNVGATGLMRQARILESQNRLAEAATLQEQALEQDPKLATGWINLISLYGRLNLFDKAESAFRKAIQAAPDQSDAYYNFGVMCVMQDRIPEAQQAFEKAIQLDPRNASALHNLGAIVERQGQLDRAARLYQQALAAMPEHHEARFKLGRIFANQRRYAEAIAQFEQLQQPVESSTPTYLYALAATHARAGHRDQAIEIMRRARQQAEQFGQQQLLSSIDRDLAALGARP